MAPTVCSTEGCHKPSKRKLHGMRSTMKVRYARGPWRGSGTAFGSREAAVLHPGRSPAVKTRHISLFIFVSNILLILIYLTEKGLLPSTDFPNAGQSGARLTPGARNSLWVSPQGVGRGPSTVATSRCPKGALAGGWMGGHPLWASGPLS